MCQSEGTLPLAHPPDVLQSLDLISVSLNDGGIVLRVLGGT